MDPVAPIHILDQRELQAIPVLAQGRQGLHVHRHTLPFDPGSKQLCADHHGFSLHAAVRIGAGQRLCRHVTRPPFAQDRLSVTRGGDVIYRFRHPWNNGKTALVMDPMTFLSRLAAQAPPPRRHVLTYHGVLAAAACKRDQIVPERAAAREVVQALPFG